MAELTTKCPREGCKVPESGTCLEGFDPWQDCPVLRGESSEHTDPPEAMSPVVPRVPLREGQALTRDEAVAVVQAARTRLIVVGGATGSGKTTLISSIYESFLAAPFSGQLFGGSLTLPGFERICHEGRASSGRDVADTRRTNPRLGIRFFHLHVVTQSVLPLPLHLLIADMSGELFRNARDSSADARKLDVLQSAMRFCLLVDGEKLVDEGQRLVAYHDARSILRALIEEGVLSSRTHLDIVFAKWDLVCEAPSERQEYIKGLRDELVDKFETKLASVTIHEVAARPVSNASPFAFGVAQLFREWVQRSDCNYRTFRSTELKTESRREFSRFARLRDQG